MRNLPLQYFKKTAMVRGVTFDSHEAVKALSTCNSKLRNTVNERSISPDKQTFVGVELKLFSYILVQTYINEHTHVNEGFFFSPKTHTIKPRK